MNRLPEKLPKRVMMTADTVGGVWTYALELARALGAYGVRVRLATMGAWLRPSQWEEAADIPTLEICESNYKLEWMDEPWSDVRQAGEWLLRLADDFAADVIHLNGYAHGSLDWQAPVLIGAHSCVLSWWQAVRGCCAPPDRDQYRREVAQGLAAADAVIAPSRSMLTALSEHYGPLRDGRVISNGRDSLLFAPGVKGNFIMTAGRLWDEAKNIGLLERIAGRLSWPVVLAGEQRHPDGGNCQIREVRLLGRLSPPRLSAWLSRAAIYALPARYEPFGLSALEAALCQCALVLGDIPSLREIWGDAAVFVNPNDDEAWREAVEELMADNRKREQYGWRARQRALEFSPQRMAAAYLATYTELMKSRHSMAERRLACA